MNTSARDTHPLVVAYLADLDRALAGTDPQERTDTLASIREHIDEALDGAEQDTATTMAVLASLGPVERIAATATPAPSSAPPTPAAHGSHPWLPVVLLSCSVVAFILVFAVPWVATTVAVATLVLAIMALRRGSDRAGLLRTSIVLSIGAIVVSVLLMVFLLATSSPEPVPGDVEIVQSSAD
ncbi:HAAS signaling domain-containing protein [Sanguibacter suarezii]|uniref:HAAS signaling domain-containing protein n=1 Tax=Sanguibacter suarezii TaxID=60921 RepID=UPI00082A384C|nr:hypothetical protein [Sanguibacter suarezii]